MDHGGEKAIILPGCLTHVLNLCKQIMTGTTLSVMMTSPSTSPTQRGKGPLAFHYQQIMKACHPCDCKYIVYSPNDVEWVKQSRMFSYRCIHPSKERSHMNWASFHEVGKTKITDDLFFKVSPIFSVLKHVIQSHAISAMAVSG